MQPVETVLHKIYVYILLFLFAVSLLGMAVLKVRRGEPVAAASGEPTVAQKLRTLLNGDCQPPQ